MNDEETAMSFQEWSEAGYYIIKGSKSQFRDINGVPQFTRDQVTLPLTTGYRPLDYANTPWQRPKGAPGPVPPPIAVQVSIPVPEAPVIHPEPILPQPI